MPAGRIAIQRASFRALKRWLHGHGQGLLCKILLLAPNYQLIGFNDKVTAVIPDVERLEDLGVLLKAALE